MTTCDYYSKVLYTNYGSYYMKNCFCIPFYLNYNIHDKGIVNNGHKQKENNHYTSPFLMYFSK